ncbi:uncharacterized protein CANTADRAFT_25337 [Suhomyces tanzawaensis NRRL Y-17324]|uniref:Uncharacterized protein n=1 Tax=Suhomyces tanzawaensis NRRL Y-17324 TaxID=984487 RepID=A0A1E4SNS8_9ASCO|nr:uncharacterized protein CANTADRAFT_25337 [Suhomyces tanzawaensis NRRL Y-17324]ODV81077.1 hypothetical protein CANTADRAFT_25337 [Suhomyces tanzawaensis NRRL Y-17324]
MLIVQMNPLQNKYCFIQLYTATLIELSTVRYHVIINKGARNTKVLTEVTELGGEVTLYNEYHEHDIIKLIEDSNNEEGISYDSTYDYCEQRREV